MFWYFYSMLFYYNTQAKFQFGSRVMLLFTLVNSKTIKRQNILCLNTVFSLVNLYSEYSSPFQVCGQVPIWFQSYAPIYFSWKWKYPCPMETIINCYTQMAYMYDKKNHLFSLKTKNILHHTRLYLQTDNTLKPVYNPKLGSGGITIWITRLNNWFFFVVQLTYSMCIFIRTCCYVVTLNF
jgi:hypothetical protein